MITKQSPKLPYLRSPAKRPIGTGDRDPAEHSTTHQVFQFRVRFFWQRCDEDFGSRPKPSLGFHEDMSPLMQAALEPLALRLLESFLGEFRSPPATATDAISGTTSKLCDSLKAVEWFHRVRSQMEKPG
jgi:hypothetical protein